MVKQSFTLDPNAQSYTDDEIVGKINTATATVSRVGFTDLDIVSEGSTNKAYTSTEQSKLSGIDEGATDDLAGTEIRDLILALADVDRGIVVTDPTAGQFKVISIERDATGKLAIQYDDVAE